jgi:hypothetical protein
MTTKLTRPGPPTVAAPIPRQRPDPDTSSVAAHEAPPPEPATGSRRQHLFHLMLDGVAVSLLIGVTVLGAHLSTMPTPAPPGLGSTWIQPVPASPGPGIRPGAKARTGWLGCPPDLCSRSRQSLRCPGLALRPGVNGINEHP